MSSSWVWKLCPVENPADPNLERYFDGVAAKIGRAIETAGREERLGIVEMGTSDTVEFRD